MKKLKADCAVEEIYFTPSQYRVKHISERFFHLIYRKDYEMFRGVAFLPTREEVQSIPGYNDDDQRSSKLSTDTLLAIVRMLYYMKFGNACLIPVWGNPPLKWLDNMMLYFRYKFFGEVEGKATRNKRMHAPFRLLHNYCFDEKSTDRMLLLRSVGIDNFEKNDQRVKAFVSQYAILRQHGESIEKSLLEKRYRMRKVAKEYSIGACAAKSLMNAYDSGYSPDVVRLIESYDGCRPTQACAKIHLADYARWIASPNFVFASGTTDGIATVNRANPLLFIAHKLDLNCFPLCDEYLYPSGRPTNNPSPMRSYELPELVGLLRTTNEAKKFGGLSELGHKERLAAPTTILDCEYTPHVTIGKRIDPNSFVQPYTYASIRNSQNQMKNILCSLAKTPPSLLEYTQPEIKKPQYKPIELPILLPIDLRHLPAVTKSTKSICDMNAGSYLLKVFSRIIADPEMSLLAPDTGYLTTMVSRMRDAMKVYDSGIQLSGFCQYCHSLFTLGDSETEWAKGFRHKFAGHLEAAVTKLNTSEANAIPIVNLQDPAYVCGGELIIYDGKPIASDRLRIHGVKTDSFAFKRYGVNPDVAFRSEISEIIPSIKDGPICVSVNQSSADDGEGEEEEEEEDEDEEVEEEGRMRNLSLLRR
jgi:hypothetical protein